MTLRSRPIQPYYDFDDEDPLGKDQFISVAATSWAVAALAITPGTDSGCAALLLPRRRRAREGTQRRNLGETTMIDLETRGAVTICPWGGRERA